MILRTHPRGPTRSRRLNAAVMLVLTVLIAGQWSAAPATVRAATGDGEVDLAAMAHDSRDARFRQPGGPVPIGTPVTLRLRTAHDDVEAANVRVADGSGPASELPMTRAYVDVPCGAPDPGGTGTCDIWEAVVATPELATLGYRFVVTDGEASGYYTDDPTVGGGPGRATRFDASLDFVITVHDPAFEPLPWLSGAVIYQIFPDRFRNGDPSNDADPLAPRYGYPPDPDAQVQRRSWDQLPEQPPRGRDYFGGDLEGVRQRLDYLADLGVEVIWFNPVFSAGSNHSYDTRDYDGVDARFGSNEELDRLMSEARARGIRIVLDGVFNHVSSDSPYFDRFGHFDALGACESVDSPYRPWFVFRDEPDGPCAGPGGAQSAGYVSWANFDSLPVLAKQVPAVRDRILEIGRQWLEAGAAGWRLDVMGDGSFPLDLWQEFRSTVKATAAEAAIIGELWQRDEVLPFVHGDTADTAMNYRFRNAVTGYLGTIDRKGFPDDGESDQPPSVFAGKIESVLEDYPAAAALTAMNILDSHDTERVLWSLTPGSPDRAGRELDVANVAIGKQRLRLAALLQMTLPGAPTIYYGDEVGVTGATDPDDRRTFPVFDESEVDPAAPPVPATEQVAAGPDFGLLTWYRGLTGARRERPVLRDGALRFLLTDDETRVLGYMRRSPDDLAIVVVNPDPAAAADVVIPLAEPADGGLPIRDGIRFVESTATVGGDEAPLTTVSADGMLSVALPPLTGRLLLAEPGQDLAGPPAPGQLSATADAPPALSWDPVADAVAYQVLRSAAPGGGYETVSTQPDTSFADDAAGPGRPWHYVVRAIDEAGNVGASSEEVATGPAEATTPPEATASPSATVPPDDGTAGSLDPGLLAIGAVLLLGAVAAAGVAFLVGRRRTGGPGPAGGGPGSST